MSRDRRERELREIVRSQQESFNRRMKESGFIERRREAMESSSSYQRRKAMGLDARRREAVEILAKNIHERNHHGEALPSYNAAVEHASRVADRVFDKLDKKK